MPPFVGMTGNRSGAHGLSCRATGEIQDASFVGMTEKTICGPACHSEQREESLGIKDNNL